MYYSASYLEEFYARVRNAVLSITGDYEIIFVNDGSPDNSLQVAVSIFENDPRVKVIDLSRNFGHHKAIMTGLSHVTGDLVYLIDCDLEEEPELIKEFYEEMLRSEADVVYGAQQNRKGGYFEKVTGALFYKIINMLSDHRVPSNLVTVRLMSRRYVDSLVEFRDQELFMAGLWVITGYKQVEKTIVKGDKGSSTYNLTRKITNLINAVTSFTNRPLIYIFYLGCLMIFGSSVSALYLIIRKVFFHVFLSGWSSLIVSIWMMGGITIFSIGVIGIYLSRVFMETKDRPYTVIRRIYKRD